MNGKPVVAILAAILPLVLLSMATQTKGEADAVAVFDVIAGRWPATAFWCSTKPGCGYDS
jgi:hypothetical protein